MKPIFKFENQTTPNGLFYDKKSHSYQEIPELPKKSQFDFRMMICSILKKRSEKSFDENYKKLIKIFNSCYLRLILKEILVPKYQFNFCRQESDFIFMEIHNLSTQKDEKYFQTLKLEIRKYLKNHPSFEYDNNYSQYSEKKFDIYVKCYHIKEHNLQYKKEKNIGI